MLVNLEELNEFWSHMLRDYPTHPAASNPQRALPIKLYGAASPESSMFFRFFLRMVGSFQGTIGGSTISSLLLYHILR